MPGGNGSSRAFAVTTENEETKMTDIIIQGIGGRMGHALCEMIANRSDCRVVAGIDQQDGEQNGIPVYDSLDKLDGKGDVIGKHIYHYVKAGHNGVTQDFLARHGFA